MTGGQDNDHIEGCYIPTSNDVEDFVPFFDNLKKSMIGNDLEQQEV